jgi:hypothetical protein
MDLELGVLSSLDSKVLLWISDKLKVTDLCSYTGENKAELKIINYYIKKKLALL